jgi:hypothetical protein
MIAEISGQGYTPWLTSDELTLLYWTVYQQQSAIFVATRSSKTATFGTPQPLTSWEAWDGSLTRDGLTLWYQQSQGTYRTTRTSTSASFTDPGSAISLAPSGLSNPVTFLARQLRGNIYFIANETGDDAHTQLYENRANTGAPILTGFSGRIDGYSVSSDERTLYLTTGEGTDAGFWKAVTFRATRGDSGQPFGALSAVTELGDPSLDQTASGMTISWVSDDECVAYGSAVITPGGANDSVLVRAVRGL